MSRNIERDLASSNLEAIYRSAVERLESHGADDQCSLCHRWVSWKSLSTCGASDGHVGEMLFCSLCRAWSQKLGKPVCMGHRDFDE